MTFYKQTLSSEHSRDFVLIGVVVLVIDDEAKGTIFELGILGETEDIAKAPTYGKCHGRFTMMH